MMEKKSKLVNNCEIEHSIRDKPTIANLTSRLSWLGRVGFSAGSNPPDLHPVNLLEHGVMTYVPNSLQKRLLNQKTMIVGRVMLPQEELADS